MRGWFCSEEVGWHSSLQLALGKPASGLPPPALSSKPRPATWLAASRLQHCFAAETHRTVPQLLALGQPDGLGGSAVSVHTLLLPGTCSEMSSTTAQLSTPPSSKPEHLFAATFSQPSSRPEAISLHLPLLPTPIPYVGHLHYFHSHGASWSLEGKNHVLTMN